MLLNCPRCGFSQPKDQYCAQCGVDMISFKPKEAPLLVRFAQNTSVQIVTLLLASAFVGQTLWRSNRPQPWSQRVSNFQGYRQSQSDADDKELSESARESFSETDSHALTAAELSQLRGQEIRLDRAAGTQTAAESGSAPGGANSNTVETNSNAAADQLSMGFVVTYAEIGSDVLARWSAESASLGLYQSLTGYSAGILYDFKKYRTDYQQNLKSSTLRIQLGSNNSVISGAMSDDGGQLLGLAVSVEHKAQENDVTSGAILVTRNTAQTSENFPAEFDLPKGAAFFIVGAVRREHFSEERGRLNMPPFQIFKSPDFMTRKTEFVIILEPDYN